MNNKKYHQYIFGLFNAVLIMSAYLVFGNKDSNLMIVIAILCLSWPLQIILGSKFLSRQNLAAEDNNHG